MSPPPKPVKVFPTEPISNVFTLEALGVTPRPRLPVESMVSRVADAVTSKIEKLALFAAGNPATIS